MKHIRRTKYKYSRFLEWISSPGLGFSFDCDANGNVASHKIARLEELLASSTLIDRGIIVDAVHTDLVICECSKCGSEVHLEGFVNSCNYCGTSYNWGGHALSPSHPEDISTDISMVS